jgi:hypothetical protein
MATLNWVVYAYSPSLNQKLRRFDLTDMNRQLDEAGARIDAENWARLQNTNQYLHATDWQGHVEYEQHGIETLDGYLFHDVTR